MEITDISSYLYFVDTEDAYSKNIFVCKHHHVIIPYVNLQLTRKAPGLSRSGPAYIDYSYLVFKYTRDFSWCYHSVGGSIYSNIKPFAAVSESRLDYYSGGGMPPNDAGCEFKVRFESLLLCIPKSSQLSPEMWLPIQTEHCAVNLSEMSVNSFFNDESIPVEILSSLGAEPEDIGLLPLTSDLFRNPDLANSWFD